MSIVGDLYTLALWSFVILGVLTFVIQAVFPLYFNWMNPRRRAPTATEGQPIVTEDERYHESWRRQQERQGEKSKEWQERQREKRLQAMEEHAKKMPTIRDLWKGGNSLKVRGT